MFKAESKRRSLVAPALLFVIVFGLWQAYYLVHASIREIPILYTYIFYVVIYLACLAAFALFIQLAKSAFREHGFKEPTNISQCLTLSLFSVIFFLLVTLAPGFTWGFGSPSFPYTFSYFTFSILNAILISLATESVFRGYIFRNLTKNHGFFTSLYVSSILFSLYQIPLTTLAGVSVDRIITYTFTDILPPFAMGIFLGFFFYKTGWSLLGPIIFRVGVLLYLFFPPVMATPPWWMKLTFEVAAYASLIVILEATIKEPKYLRRKYGLES